MSKLQLRELDYLPNVETNGTRVCTQVHMTVKPHFYYPMLDKNKLQQVGSNGGDRTGRCFWHLEREEFLISF